MPAEGIHLTALREAAFSGALAAEPRRAIVRYEDAARLGAIVLDLPYFDRYLEEVVRYALRLPPQASPWGAAVHERAAVPIVRALLERARSERSQRLLALALGAASHAALDRALHPLINALARRFAQGRSHDEAHREVEKFQSICFHEAYFGRDRMGTPGIVRLVAVPAVELLADPPVADALEAAYRAGVGEAEVQGALQRMALGYERHARLLGGPLGGVLASERDKEVARPRFLAGLWGRFEDVLSAAIQGIVPVLERAWAVYAASQGELEGARRAFEASLPLGSIDSAGDGVDLDAAFTPAPPSEV